MTTELISILRKFGWLLLLKIRGILSFIFLTGKWRTRAVSNWTVFPIVMVTIFVWSGHVKSLYSDADKYTENKIKSFKGNVVFYGRGKRKFYIKSRNDRVYVSCLNHNNTSNPCFSDKIRPIKEEVIIKYYRYEGNGNHSNIASEIKTLSGAVLLSKEKSVSLAKYSTESAKQHTWASESLPGLIVGLSVSLFRQVIFIPLLRRKLRLQNKS